MGRKRMTRAPRTTRASLRRAPRGELGAQKEAKCAKLITMPFRVVPWRPALANCGALRVALRVAAPPLYFTPRPALLRATASFCALLSATLSCPECTTLT